MAERFNFLEWINEDTIPVDTTSVDTSNQELKDAATTLLDPDIIKSAFMTPEAYTALEFQAEDALDLAVSETERYNAAVGKFTDIKSKYNTDMTKIKGLQGEQAELYEKLKHAEKLAYPDMLAKMFGARNDKLEKRYLDIRNMYNSIGLEIKKIDDYWHKTPKTTGGGGYGLGQVATPGTGIPAIRKLSKIDAANQIFDSLDRLKKSALESTTLGGGALPEGVVLSDSEVSIIKELDPDFDIDHLFSAGIPQPLIIKDTEKYAWGTTAKKLRQDIESLESRLKRLSTVSGHPGDHELSIDLSKEFGISTGMVSWKNQYQKKRDALESEYNEKINLYNKMIEAN